MRGRWLFAAFGAGALIAGLVVRGHRRGGAGGFDYDDDLRGLDSEAIDLRAEAPVGAATRGANIDYNLRRPRPRTARTGR